MDIETYLDLHTTAKMFPLKKHYFTDYGERVPYTVNMVHKEIRIEGIVPFSLTDVIVEMFNISYRMVNEDEDQDEDEEQTYDVFFLLPKYSGYPGSRSIHVSYRTKIVKYNNYDRDIEVNLLSPDFKENFFHSFDEGADIEAARIFEFQFETLDLPEKLKETILNKFDSSKYKATERRKEDYLERVLRIITKEFEGFDVTDFLFSDKWSSLDIFLIYKPDTEWYFEEVADVFATLKTKLHRLYLDIPRTLDLIYYQLMRDEIAYKVDVKIHKEMSFTIGFSISFNAHSNETYFDKNGPGYYLSLVDNVCSGRFAKDDLTDLLKYFQIPDTDDLNELCTALKDELAYLTDEGFYNLTQIQD